MILLECSFLCHEIKKIRFDIWIYAFHQNQKKYFNAIRLFLQISSREVDLSYGQ